MSLTIGRAGRDSGLPLPDPDDVVLSGNQLDLSGFVYATTEADTMALTQQLRGLTDSPDEPVVTITFDEHPYIDGFYRVDSMTVTRLGGHTDGDEAEVAWAGTFTRLLGFTSTVLESLVSCAMLTNPYDVVASDVADYLGLPPGFLSVDDPENVGTFGLNIAEVRDTADGIMQLVSMSADPPFQGGIRWTITPDAYYAGAVRLTAGSHGYTDSIPRRTVIGRQIDGPLITPDFLGARIDNGLVRFQWDDGSFQIAHWDGTAWLSPIRWLLLSNFTTTQVVLDTIVAWRVLRNTPEAVAVRLTMTASVNPTSLLRYDVDVVVRRGSRRVDFFFSSLFTAEWGIAKSTPAAASALSAAAPFGSSPGIRAATGNNRWVIGSAYATSQDLTNGALYVDDPQPTSAAFFVSMEVDVAYYGDHDEAESQVLQFLYGLTERVIASAL